MTSNLTCEKLFSQNKIVPVIILNDIDKAVSLAHALKEGGINIMEVTLRTPKALQVIEAIRNKTSNIIVGAGTVLTEDQYHLSIKHGAEFIVSPGLNKTFIELHNEYDAPLLPGAVTPTEILSAYNSGFNYLKFFPAESYNGHNVLKSLAPVFQKVKFCPTGGINLDNIKNYLELPNVVGVGCSFLVTEELLASNNYAKITELAKQAVTLSI